LLVLFCHNLRHRIVHVCFSFKTCLSFITSENWMIILFVWAFITKSGVIKKCQAVCIVLLILFFGNDFMYTRVVNAWQPSSVALAEGVSNEGGICIRWQQQL